MAVQNWALISLALANLSHPAQVSMKDHESLQTTSYIKYHQITSSDHSSFRRTQPSQPFSKISKGSRLWLLSLAPVSRVPAPTKPGHRTSLASAQRHLESSLWWAICDAIIFHWLNSCCIHREIWPQNPYKSKSATHSILISLLSDEIQRQKNGRSGFTSKHCIAVLRCCFCSLEGLRQANVAVLQE